MQMMKKMNPKKKQTKKSQKMKVKKTGFIPDRLLQVVSKMSSCIQAKFYSKNGKLLDGQNKESAVGLNYLFHHFTDLPKTRETWELKC